MKILIASNNHHKIREISNILDSNKFSGIELLSLNQISRENFDVIENGSSFEENAKIKAISFLEKFGIPTISDDSGLEVDVLGGAPGIFSARFSGINSTDESNRKKLKDEILSLGLGFSSAHFKCCISFYDGKELLTANGICNGKIILEERGFQGFGYDSMFIPEGYDLTFAEIKDEIKNQISHRANALKNFLPIFANYYRTLSNKK